MYSGTAAYLSYYMLNAPRIAANTKIADVYSNNKLTANKREVLRIQNFNRKFLPEEIEQFLHNENLITKGRKRYTYNPHVHGEDEAKFKTKFERVNSGEHSFSQQMMDSIRSENQLKLDNHEVVRLVPWKARTSLN